MPDLGLQDEGFLAKSLEQIIADLSDGWIAIYGTNADTDPDTPDGQMIGLIAGMFDEVWQTSGELNSVFDPQQARGVLLSKLVQLNGLLRADEVHTVVIGQVVGVPPATLEAGAIAETTDGDRFLNLIPVAFSGSSQTAVFRAEDPGPVPAAAGTLTVITTPITGWTSVTNAAGPLLAGVLEETDGDLRRRREQSTAQGAVHTFTALKAAVLAVESVVDAELAINEGLTTDGLGLPGKSYRVIVEGGADDDIAQATWDNHAAGIGRSGAESGNATDSNGTTQAIQFARPDDVTIFIDLVIATDADFPSGGDTLIKQAIIDFAAGLLQKAGTDPAQFHDGIDIGDDVEYSRLFTPINSVPGHTVTSFGLGTAPAPVGTINLPISLLEKAEFLIGNISVA